VGAARCHPSAYVANQYAPRTGSAPEEPPNAVSAVTIIRARDYLRSSNYYAHLDQVTAMSTGKLMLNESW
jgi:hypothetical protein